MAKKGTYSGPFFGSFAARLHGTPIRFGLLVGTEAEEDRLRDVLFAAPTPPQPGEDGQPAAPPKDALALLRSKGSADFVAWAQQHADAVRRLMPGGLEPCGCFALVPEADAKDLAPMLVPLLKGVSDPLVLTIDTRTKKLSFWQHSGGAKPSLRPAQLKADPHEGALLLWSSTSVDVVVPCAADPEGGEGIDGAAVDALAGDVERDVREALSACSVGLAAGAEESGPLTLVDMASEADVSSVAPKGCQELRVAYLRSSSGPVVVPNPDGKPCVRQRCSLVGTAVVLRRSGEMRQAVDLLTKALASSAGHRLQLALEEAEGAAKGRLNLPWRALCRPAGMELPFWCGDYCMPDEDVANARERLGQLLGTSEDAFEAAPGNLDERARLERDHPGTYKPVQEEKEEPPGVAGGKPPVSKYCGVAVAVLLLAVAVPFLLPR